MAELAGVIYTSHAWVNRPWTEWEAERAARHHREDVPIDNDKEMAAKSERMLAANQLLADKLREMRPDALVIFGDDQHECFNFNNFPAIAVYLGAELAGRVSKKGLGHPGLATGILSGLLDRGFDPAFCMDSPNPERGMPHAIMNPLDYYDAYSIPTVPILMNAYYAPQVTAKRHYQVGRAVREIIDGYPDDLRVVVIGSGGLWHTPRKDGAYLDEEFDRTGLALLQKGEIAAWADFFDNYKVPAGDASQAIDADVPLAEQRLGDAATHLPSPGGPQAGTRETCNWIGAAGVADGRPSVLVDYVPVYASPIGVAFAYCDDV